MPQQTSAISACPSASGKATGAPTPTSSAKQGRGNQRSLETFIKSDLHSGQGLALLDPHGDLIEKALGSVPEERREDVVYFNVPEAGPAVSFNPLEGVGRKYRLLAASGMLAAFKGVWADSWGPRLEHILRNSLLALLDQEHATLADMPRLLEDKAFRRQVTSRVENAQVRHFWLKEYEGYPARFRAEAIAPLQNKIGAFLANPVLNRILTQRKASLRLRRLMDEGKVLLVNLAKGKVGEDTASLLGSLIVSRLALAALTRADTPEEARRDFYLYLDEFQSFTTVEFAGMLSGLRKYHLNLTLAHQYLSQLDPQVRDGILGNVGTLICFRIGMIDAEIFAQEFYPRFSKTDLVSLPNYHIYLKLMVNGQISEPFSAKTLPPLN